MARSRSGPRPAAEIAEIPELLVERLKHYFLTYKMVPGQESDVSIDRTYGADHAVKVVEASMKDYDEEYGR